MEAVVPADPTAAAIAAAASTAATAAVNALSTGGFRAPTFWYDKPEVWFAKLEVLFEENAPKISLSCTKFNKTLPVLNQRVFSEVEDAVIYPPSVNCYKNLKAAVLKAFGRSQAAKDDAIWKIDGFGGRNATSFLRYLRSLSPNLPNLFRNHSCELSSSTTCPRW
ncbi:hypothetical protein TCAL_17224 [Tigriopus californicus]|uniref:DUF7041 domain-containing protein n=1 Tax=Tigriopus californicus TaxID=6832 RepID=A0A553N8N6_TIGCA|nr:hypothetical protein TCAL_17224 [Tigriopus californicus]